MDYTEIQQMQVKKKSFALYLKAEQCSICDILLPKIQSLFDENFPLMTLIPASDKIFEKRKYFDKTCWYAFDGFSSSKCFDLHNI